MSVDFFPEPTEERGVITAMDGIREGGKIAVGGLPKLGCGEIPQSIGGEITESPQRPVDVLQATAGIIGDLETEEFFEKLVPGGGKVTNSKVSFEKLGFQFETEKDVEVVCDFVCLHTDEGALDGIRSPPGAFGGMFG
jgi:hypothetical protein